MDNWDSLHIEQIKDNTAKMADAFARIADALERLEARKTEPQYDFGEYADRLWKIAYERGKREALEQTEPQTCDDCIWSVCNYNKAFADEPQTERSE